MKRAVQLGALWVAATVITGAAAWGAVQLAGEHTADSAVEPMSARQVEGLTTTTRPDSPATTVSSVVPGTTTTLPSGPTAPAARQTRGGTVLVSLLAGELALVSATPAPGYSVEVEEAGPEEVLVAFESEADEEVRVRAYLDDGEVAFEVSSGGGD